MATREVITKAQQFKLFTWMTDRKQQLDGWTIAAAAERARTELKFSFTDKTFASIARHSGAGIKFANQGNKHSPMTVIFERIKALEVAYFDLCSQVGVTPHPNIKPSKDE